MKNIFLVIALLSGGWAKAVVAPLVPQGGAVEVLAIGKPSFIKIRGQGRPAEGRVAFDAGKLSGQFKFELASIDTGIGLRNEHMKDKYLEVQKFPTANLELKDVALPSEWSLEKAKTDELPFVGSLNLHGVTREVSGKFHVTEAAAVVAEFKIKLTDFAIQIPEYMGIKVADEVSVKVKIDRVQAEAGSKQ